MVIVDRRAGSEALHFTAALRDRSQLGTLEFGDVMLAGNGPNGTITVGIEVKSVDDLLSSISTGRLAGHQLPGLVKTYDHSWIAVFGKVRPGPDNYLEVQKHGSWKNFKIGRQPVPYSYLAGFELTAQFFSPVRIKWLQDLDEVAIWISVLDRWLSKPWDKHKGLSVFNRSQEQAAPVGADPVEAQMARIAADLPGVGWTRGWAAAKHFDSVADMLNAHHSEWQKIDGIGPTIAKAVYTAIRRKK